MKEKIQGSIGELNGNLSVFTFDGKTITHLFRPDMIKKAYENGQGLEFNEDTGRGKRIELSNVTSETTVDVPKAKIKYLIRSVVRGKNIMMVGPAGCGKTQAAKSLPEATNQPFFYFNLGATQDPRSTLIGNTHFKDGETLFDKSPFVKALETENAIILLDELSRAHPEAWNILMTVLDEEQRYS